jgi:hypothetical protein
VYLKSLKKKGKIFFILIQNLQGRKNRKLVDIFHFIFKAWFLFSNLKSLQKSRKEKKRPINLVSFHGFQF